MRRVKWVLLGVIAATLPVVVWGATQLSLNGNNGYWSCDCIGVSIDHYSHAVGIGRKVDEGLCIGMTVRCERCCQCY